MMDFPTREELLKFRTTTTLLAHLNVLEIPRELEEYPIPRWSRYKPGRSEKRQRALLSHFMRLLVRSNEALAIAHTGHTGQGLSITAVLEDNVGDLQAQNSQR